MRHNNIKCFGVIKAVLNTCMDKNSFEKKEGVGEKPTIVY